MEIILSVMLLIAVYAVVWLGHVEVYAGGWIFCEDAVPPPKNHIENYPVAFFDAEFGIIHDQAEYHGRRAHKWLSVPDGTPVHPFAWYDLPSSPHPRQTQDIGIKTGINDYI